MCLTNRSEKVRIADEDGDEDSKEEPGSEDDNLEGLVVPCRSAAAAEQRHAQCSAISKETVHAALTCCQAQLGLLPTR